MKTGCVIPGVVVRGRRNPLHHGLAARLKSARDLAGTNAVRLSLDAGLARTAVLQAEKGHVPKLDTVERLARALGVSPCALAYGIECTARPDAAVPTMLCESVRERLAQVREAQGLSRRGLAKAAGMTTTGISYIESGRTMPSVATVERLAKALGIDPCWLGYGHGTAPDLLPSD